MYRLLFIVLLCKVTKTNELSKNYGSKIFKYWNRNWGFCEETNNESTTPSNPKIATQEMEVTTPRMETETLPSFCLPIPQPDFRKPGRRLSEVKCQEYIWEMNTRVASFENYFKCLSYKTNIHPTIGGLPTRPGEYPHMGAIGWKSSAPNGTWVFKCGSSLISEKFVLTAAHCTRALPNDPSITDPVPKIVRLGDKNISDRKYYFVSPSDARICNIIIHPSYRSPKQYYDIALMELEHAVTFSKLIQPACLWDSFDTRKLGKDITLTGWGVVESGSLKFSPELNAASVDIISSDTCDDFLKDSHNRNWRGLKEHQLCAGKLIGGVDACQGDSGGPLQAKIPQNNTLQGQMHYVFGVISFGVGCARSKLPGIYTRVASFIDWIEDNVWRNQLK